MSAAFALVRLARPRQWTKNAFVLAGCAFAERASTDGTLEHVLRAGGLVSVAAQAAAAVCGFILLSAAVYVFNDIGDAERDRLHPVKRSRPVAAGDVSPWAASFYGALLFGAGMAVAEWLPRPFLWIAVSYVAINAAYTMWWKNVVVLDILSVSSGFVLRVLAGVIAVEAVVGPWIVACTMFLALLISLGKRRSEVVLLGDDAGSHRRILDEYPLPFLDKLIVTTSGITVMTYALFTFESGRGAALMLTIPLVIYGVFRYLYLMYVSGATLPPEELVLKDRALLITGLAWGILSAGLVAVS